MKLLGRIFRWATALTGIFVVVNIALAMFERFAPPKAVRFYMKYLGNPALRGVSAWMPGFAVLEVVGRKTGRPRQVNVGGRVIGDAFWFLARKDAHYVRNLEANPRVRIRFQGRWHDGVAHLMPDESPRPHLLHLNAMNGAFLWLVGVDLMPVRVDLENSAGAGV
jgi:deazaflavin-dependent oxidoreductase (nitroreductase family)